MHRKFLICSILLFPVLALSYQQQYISATPTSINQTSGQSIKTKNSLFANNKGKKILPSNNPMNIYLTPEQQQRQIQSSRKQYQVYEHPQTQMPQQPYFQEEKHNQWENLNKHPQQDLKNQKQPFATNSTLQQSAKSFAQSISQSSNNKSELSQYTQQQQAVWLQNCMQSVKNNKAKILAQPFCSCGWRHIASGELAPELLDSYSQTDIKKANNILKVISETCMVEVMAPRK